MDFWASLEHKIYYKFEGNAPEYISRDLRECAKMVSELDEKMLSLNEAIQECILQQEKTGQYGRCAGKRDRKPERTAETSGQRN